MVAENATRAVNTVFRWGGHLLGWVLLGIALRVLWFMGEATWAYGVGIGCVLAQLAVWGIARHRRA